MMRTSAAYAIFLCLIAATAQAQSFSADGILSFQGWGSLDTPASVPLSFRGWNTMPTDRPVGEISFTGFGQESSISAVTIRFQGWNRPATVSMDLGFESWNTFETSDATLRFDGWSHNDSLESELRFSSWNVAADMSAELGFSSWGESLHAGTEKLSFESWGQRVAPPETSLSFESWNTAIAPSVAVSFDGIGNLPQPAWEGTWTTKRGDLTIHFDGANAIVVPEPGGFIGRYDGSIEVTHFTEQSMAGLWRMPLVQMEGTFLWTLKANGREFEGQFSEVVGDAETRSWWGAKQ